ncbi:MAG: hypothetical protein E7D78_09325 [Prevotella bivia]|nr:hypothetical protein [Prevotella bivia]
MEITRIKEKKSLHTFKDSTYASRLCHFNGVVSRMAPKIGTAVCGTACTVV